MTLTASRLFSVGRNHEEKDETTSRLSHLYTHAGDLEIELRGVMGQNPDTIPTAPQIGRYNQLLADAREILPKSIALREDVEEIAEDRYEQVRTAELYRALHTTIVPTLHNALPEEE